MEINTKIIEIKQALGKDSNKLYWQVETSDGRMTCHEKTVIDGLMEFVGGMCNLTVRQTPKADGNGFWNNITGIVQDNEGITYSKPKTQENSQTIPKIVNNFNKVTNEVLNTQKTNFKEMANVMEKGIEVEVKPIIKKPLPILATEKPTRTNTDVNCDVMCAKDIFATLDNKNGIANARMELAIQLVKQARDSFS